MFLGIKKYFLNEKQMLIAVVLNAVVIFFLYFPQIADFDFSLFQTLDLLDRYFVLLFMLEAVVKIRHYGWRRYLANPWFVFDFIIVLISIPGMLHFLGLPIFPDTSIFQLLRIFRLARLIRFLRFIPNIRMILAGLKRAMRASIFVLLALSVFNFIVSMFACHFYGDLVPDYFGDPLISGYYIFQMFTVEGWNEIPNTIAHAAREANLPHAQAMIVGARLFFIFVVLIGGIFGMSLANAIFVDEMTMDNTRKLERQVEQLRKQLVEIKGLLEKQ